MNNITPDTVSKHLGSLLGMPVKGAVAKPTDLKGAAVVATVKDEAGNLCCLMHCDVAAAASTGAALSRIPMGMVQEAVKKGKVEDGLLDNYKEIANILTVLTTAALDTRTILDQVVQGPEAKAADIEKFLKAAKKKYYAKLTIQGYPDGIVGFVG